jgi:hypothetical protein
MERYKTFVDNVDQISAAFLNEYLQDALVALRAAYDAEHVAPGIGHAGRHSTIRAAALRMLLDGDDTHPWVLQQDANGIFLQGPTGKVFWEYRDETPVRCVDATGNEQVRGEYQFITPKVQHERIPIAAASVEVWNNNLGNAYVPAWVFDGAAGHWTPKATAVGLLCFPVRVTQGTTLTSAGVRVAVPAQNGEPLTTTVTVKLLRRSGDTVTTLATTVGGPASNDGAQSIWIDAVPEAAAVYGEDVDHWLTVSLDRCCPVSTEASHHVTACRMLRSVLSLRP